MSWVGVAGFLGASGVAAGAFGAHGLREHLTPEILASWDTAVLYHLLHSLAILALGLVGVVNGRKVHLPASLFTAGVFLFSGSIYALALGLPRVLGPVTPLGGLCLIAGWISLPWWARSSAKS
ncbi:MAG: DUF423 domain-containing protein [bacterium]|nr:DUF423 domain-containing protein [bacterium]